MDRWDSKVVQCSGGLVLDVDALTQGTTMPGTARVLQNYEPAVEGGYRRINGYIKFDDDVVPGDADEPVTGVKVALGGVYAVRKTSTDNKVYFSSGSGWGSALNGTARTGAVTKARWISYSITEPVAILTDGFNPAWKHNGTVETLLNGAGAPADPKYAALFRNRLVLAGYTANTSAITLSAPNDDEDYSGASGAIEINVGDTIVGLKTFRNELYIFCERAVKKLVGNTEDDFAIEEVVKSVGCVSGDTVQEVGGDLIFLSVSGFRSIAATERIGDIELGVVSKQIQPLLRDYIGSSFSLDDYSSCVIRKKSQYRLLLNDDNATAAETVGFIGKLNIRGEYEWSTTLGIEAYCADSDFQNQVELVVMGHSTNGYVYRLESGSDFDGTNIYYVFRSPDLTFDDATLRKVFQKLTMFAQVEGDIDFSVNLILDRGDSSVIQPLALAITQSGEVSLYGVALYGTGMYSALQYPILNKNLVGSGFTGALQVSGTDGTAPHRIDSYQITYAQKGRR